MNLKKSNVACPSLWKGLLAGAVGGLLAAGVKAAAEVVYPPRTEAQTPPPVVLFRKLSSRQVDPAMEQKVFQATHYGFGLAVGAAYGALAEYEPSVTTGRGLAFGLGLNVLTHETLLPLLALSDPPTKQTAREQTSEALTHAIYGVATEITRSFIRNKL